jgi:hypothetical protein
MTWVTWQQHRLAAAVGAAVIVLAAAILGLVGLQVAADFQQSGVAACIAQSSQASSCSDLRNQFFDRWSEIEGAVQNALAVLPVLVGMFLGAPLLARELEQGTHRLAWTQSVTRLRWALVKLILLTLGVIVVAGLVTVAFAWSHRPLDQASGSPFATFDVTGVAPVAYALFAFALGVAIGTVTGRTVVAMGLTLALFAGVRYGIEDALRPRYLAPAEIRWDPAVQDPRPGQGDWILPTPPGAFARRIVDSSGHTLSDQQVNTLLRRIGGPNSQYLHDHGYLYSVLYQAGDRFWVFQGIEAAIFLGLAILLMAFSLWWIRRRVA